MSQHSFSIANEAGAAFRADVNSALQALASCSRGATAPGTTYAAQVWDDSTANVQKKRNTANSGWLVKSTLDETFVLSRSSNTILGLSDIGKAILATAGFTQTLTAAATLGDGWFCDFFNASSAACTIDPNGAEQINGGTTLTVPAGSGGRIWCNGSAFQMGNAPAIATASWTPGIAFGGGTTGITYGTQSGWYSRYGGLIVAPFDIVLTSKGSSTGALTITGFPVTATGGPSEIFIIDFLSMTTAVSTLLGRIVAGGTTATVKGTPTARTSNLAMQDTDLSNTTQLTGTAIYHVP